MKSSPRTPPGWGGTAVRVRRAAWRKTTLPQTSFDRLRTGLPSREGGLERRMRAGREHNSAGLKSCARHEKPAEARSRTAFRTPPTSSPSMGEDRGEGEKGRMQQEHPPLSPSHQGRGVGDADEEGDHPPPSPSPQGRGARSRTACRAATRSEACRVPTKRGLP